MIVPKNPHLNLSAIADSANASAGGGSPNHSLYVILLPAYMIA